jgi:thioredoxin reductase (NADPH)
LGAIVVSNNQYDVVIAGGGIAGLTAGLLSARAGRRTRVLTGPALGGQLLNIERIDGYPGFPDGIAGYDLCPMIQEQAVAAGAEFTASAATRLTSHDGRWKVASGEGEVQAGAVVIASGTKSKELGIPGEVKLRGKGVSHCASCDGPLLRAKVVGVVGGGDSAMQEALTLAKFASRVIMLHRGAELSGQAAYRDAVRNNDRIEVRANTIVDEVLGDGVVTGVRTRTAGGSASGASPAGGTVADLELAALFVYIGLTPETAWLNGLVELDASGRIPTDEAMRTGLPGLFAAGTVRSGSAGRAVSAAGDGALAAVAADQYLKDSAWRV